VPENGGPDWSNIRREAGPDIQGLEKEVNINFLWATTITIG
jgi:hypothetical protein